MRVIVAQSAGFCRGVRRAVDRARALAASSRGPVYTDGPLIHNEQMMARLRREGVTETDNPGGIGCAPLLLRAHGVAPDRRAALAALQARLVDATCPDVARIQGLVRRHARRGCQILIHGDAGHAEVDGLLGYAEGRGRVLDGPGDVARLPSGLDRVCLVAQSTQLPRAYAEVAAAVRARFPRAVVLDTVCASTKNRQSELLALAGRVEAFVVVGGAHSANTMRLVKLARSMKPTFHIQTADQLEPPALARYRAVGLTAGASTPTFIIEEVRRALADIAPR